MSGLPLSVYDLTPVERTQLIDSLTDDQLGILKYDWRFWARKEQLAPIGDWSIWLALAGRGFGKTRLGAEFIRDEVSASRAGRIALVAPTAADARDVMIEGDSGLLSVCPNWDRPQYEPSKRRVTWSNGAVATVYSAEDPDQLRGPQHDTSWSDEICAWARMQDTFDMLQFGMRLGQRPRQVITTTPRPYPLIRNLMARSDVVVTRGKTMDNAANLADPFITGIQSRYAGTRLGRQELDAEILDDVEGALWTGAMLDAGRVQFGPQMRRIVVAVDPSGCRGPDDFRSDEIGIIVCGIGADDGHGYVIADHSGRYSPEGWGSMVARCMRDYDADAFVGESNFGGDMVRSTVHAVDARLRYIEVRASRGKSLRAEPVAGLYEQQRVHHIGRLDKLEDQMCLAAGTLIETDKGFVAIEHINTHHRVLTRNGFAPIKWAGYTGNTSQMVEIGTKQCKIRATKYHPIFVSELGRFVNAVNVLSSNRLCVSRRWEDMARQSHGEAAGITACLKGTIDTPRVSYFIASFMRYITAEFLLAWISTISMKTLEIIEWKISDHIRGPITSLNTRQRVSQCLAKPSFWANASFVGIRQKLLNLSQAGIALTAATCRNIEPQSHVSSHFTNSNANVAERPGNQSDSDNSVPCAARTITMLRHTNVENEPVYNISVADGYLPEFFANGILVHNCNFTAAGYVGERSPDRADAMVHGLTELLLGDQGTWTFGSLN